MTVYVAKSPQDFRAKAFEMGATSLVYLNGPFGCRVPIEKRTQHCIEEAFDECIRTVSASANKEGKERMMVPLSVEAYKDKTSIIMGKWLVLSVKV